MAGNIDTGKTNNEFEYIVCSVVTHCHFIVEENEVKGGANYSLEVAASQKKRLFLSCFLRFSIHSKQH